MPSSWNIRRAACRMATALLIAGAAAGSAGAVTLVGVFDGNDPFPRNITGTLPSGATFNSPALAKCDVADKQSPSCSWSNGPTDGSVYSGAFGVSFTSFKTDGDAIGGSWTYNPAAVTGTASPLLPSYLVVKASNRYALYSLDGATSGGSWSTGDLLNNGGQQPGISHLSFYDSLGSGPGPDEVPEIDAASGLGALGALGGLLAFGWERRRRVA